MGGVAVGGERGLPCAQFMLPGCAQEAEPGEGGQAVHDSAEGQPLPAGVGCTLAGRDRAAATDAVPVLHGCSSAACGLYPAGGMIVAVTTESGWLHSTSALPRLSEPALLMRSGAANVARRAMNPRWRGSCVLVSCMLAT